MKITLSREEWQSVLIYWDCPNLPWWRGFVKDARGFSVAVENETGGETVCRVTKSAFEAGLSLLVTDSEYTHEIIGSLVSYLSCADSGMRDAVLQRVVFQKEVFS